MNFDSSQSDAPLRCQSQACSQSQEPAPSQPTPMNDFILWIDGVGGYLICTGHENKIGQAIPESNVTIPLRGDLDREHGVIQTVDDRHLIDPIGEVRIDGRLLHESAVLIDQQTIQLGDMVELRYRKPHPLSSTAVLDFVSRHRTFPWSDGALIAGETIVMGPQSRNHIVCPFWSHELILFRRRAGWFCKTDAVAYVDGDRLEGRRLKDQSRITGDGFSLSVESIS